MVHDAPGPRRIQNAVGLMISVCFVFLLSALVGCASTGETPSAALPKDIPADWAASPAARELPISTSLLDLIDDARVSELVREALENNPDLNATALRLKAAGYLLSAPRSRLIPRVNAEASTERSNQGVNLENGKRAVADSRRLGLGVSWEIDLWGRLADEYAAAAGDVLAREYDYRHGRDALAARVIQGWIEQIAIRRSLAIGVERIAVLERIETVLIDRYKGGVGNLEELSTAKSRTEIARADVSVRRATLHRSIRKLEILLGRYPRGELLSGDELPAAAPPSVGLPAEALLSRPDIQAALARVETAMRLSSAAKKALLPEVRLSARVFKEAARLDGLGGADACWEVLGSLFQPLFEGGRILDESRARSAEAEAWLMELRAVVLRALAEAEEALDQEQELAARARALQIASRESEKSSRYFKQRYRQGLDAIQSLLIAKEQEMAVKDRLSEVEAERLRNRVDLALALGGGVDSGDYDHLYMWPSVQKITK